MIKFLLVLFIIFIAALLILGTFFKKLFRFFGVGSNDQFDASHQRSGNKNNGDVIYNKDDVVVMKGEAKNKKNINDE
jgi:hypothetical protein